MSIPFEVYRDVAQSNLRPHSLSVISCKPTPEAEAGDLARLQSPLSFWGPKMLTLDLIQRRVVPCVERVRASSAYFSSCNNSAWQHTHRACKLRHSLDILPAFVPFNFSNSQPSLCNSTVDLLKSLNHAFPKHTRSSLDSCTSHRLSFRNTWFLCWERQSRWFMQEASWFRGRLCSNQR